MADEDIWESHTTKGSIGVWAAYLRVRFWEILLCKLLAGFYLQKPHHSDSLYNLEDKNIYIDLSLLQKFTLPETFY